MSYSEMINWFMCFILGYAVLEFVLSLFLGKKGKVYLIFYDGGRKKVTARYKGLAWYAYPYLPDTTCRLKPGGTLVGQSYLDGWEPISHNMIEYYFSDERKPAPPVEPPAATKVHPEDDVKLIVINPKQIN